MKKIICVLMTIIVMACCMTVGYATETEENENMFTEWQIENAIELTAGSYVGGIDFPAGEYILYIDNKMGTEAVALEYRCAENPDQETNQIVPVGYTFEMYVTVYETDTLITNGLVNLYINLE